MPDSTYLEAVEEHFLMENVDDQECLLYVEFKAETDRQWLTKARCKGYKELKQAGIEVLKCVTYADPRSFVLTAIDATHQWVS